MGDAKKMAVGFVVGIIGGVVWQNTVKLGVIVILLMMGQRLSSVASTASTLGLLTSLGMIVYYTWRARKYDSVQKALGGSLMRAGYALLYFAGIGGFYYMTVGNSRGSGMQILLISFLISVAFFFVGRFIYNRQAVR